MKDSTKRTLRTIYHGVIGAIGAVPTIVLVVHDSGLDQSQDIATAMGAMVVWTAAASKAINSAEDRGLIPAFLKSGTDQSVSEEDPISEAPASEAPASEDSLYGSDAPVSGNPQTGQ